MIKNKTMVNNLYTPGSTVSTTSCSITSLLAGYVAT